MIKVLLADDHAIVREGLKRILAETSEFTVVGEAASSPEALAELQAHRPDVVILDISMPGRGPVETLHEIKRLAPKARVLFLSMHPESQYAARLFSEGADGYLSKESAPELLVEALRKIHGGGKYVSPALAEELAQRLAGDYEVLRHERLSDRELQVFRLLGGGKTVTEISRELNLSPKTISTYRTRILEKTGLHSTAEIIHYAVRHGLA
jgi:DNA-binding NarL/FixJ family response regulator